MSEAKRQHYVPEFYQRNFVDLDGRLWMYDRNIKKFIRTSPSNICCEKEIYTIDPGGARNRSIETQHLSQIDGDGATAIRKLARGEKLDQDWTESFAIYIAFQLTRSPAFRKMVLQNYQAMGEEFLRIGFTDVERARQMLESYRRITGDTADNVTPESMVEAVTGGHIRTTVNEGPFLSHMFQQVEFLARWIASFEWEIVQSPPDSGFIISDYPFVLVPPRAHPEATGFGFPGTVKYFPLTRSLCLRMGEPGYGFSWKRMNKEDVRLINQNVAVNSERFIMGPSRPQLEYVIARSGTEAPDPTPRTTLKAMEQDADGTLFRVTFWPRRRYFHPKL